MEAREREREIGEGERKRERDGRERKREREREREREGEERERGEREGGERERREKEVSIISYHSFLTRMVPLLHKASGWFVRYECVTSGGILTVKLPFHSVKEKTHIHSQSLH